MLQLPRFKHDSHGLTPLAESKCIISLQLFGIRHSDSLAVSFNIIQKPHHISKHVIFHHTCIWAQILFQWLETLANTVDTELEISLFTVQCPYDEVARHVW